MLTIGFSKKQLQNGAYDEVLARLTCKKDITAARGRVMDLLLQYQETFKAGEDSRIAVLSAPGRTEIGGNHTDHQRGHVLAAAINLDQLACAAPNGTSLIRLHSKGYEPLSIDISTLSPVESEKYTTSALIRGIAARISEMGYKLHGFDACVVSDVASGSGLSSSAAFEVLAGLIINHLYCSDLLSPEELARIGQYSENVYFGKPCGLMDQMASAHGGLITIDFMEPERPQVKRVPFDFEKTGHVICIIDSGADHADLTEDYAAIPAEMKSVAALFGKEVLSQVDRTEFYARLNEVRNGCGDRAMLRALHFFTDDRSVLREVEALEQGDFESFLREVTASGRSSYQYLQNVISGIDSRSQNVAVALALAERLLGGRGAFRVHGGGFAGTIQAFVPGDMIEAFVLGTEQVLGKGSCHVLSIRPVGGTVLLGIPPVEQRVCQLVEHALKHGLITGTDRLWAENSIISILKRDCYTRPEQCDEEPVADVLNALIQYARDNGIIEDDNEAADRFDTMLAGILTPRPGEVVRRFRSLYEEEPGRATGWFYEFCQQVNYIRSDRIARDVKWVTETEYGPVDITINLSKPEKDPKAIAAALNQKASGYPACQLCIENEGYAGRPGHPARQNLRLIPVVLDHEQWYFQYSPYSYYNEHCIVLNGEHTPMRINRSTFRKLLDFVKKFPEYFIGSNADLPIVGGSILTHDHFQGGRYTFAMERAPVETEIVIPGYEEVRAGIVKWPMSVIRLTCEDDLKLEVLAEHILESWKAYSDEDCGILSETCGVPHNTVTPIARRQGKSFQLDLVLRNNRTTAEHPYGLFHPHEELHHIKKENIGLIEVMGLAVLPARLKLELSAIARGISAGDDPAANPLTQSHAEWVRDICSRYPNLKADDIEAILKEETGRVFVKVMEHSGVYKCDETGKTAFLRFVSQL